MLSIAVNLIADELAKVNNSNEITAKFQFKKIDHPSLLLFSKFFDDLVQTLTKESTLTPPGETTVPADLRHCSPSTESTTSRDSKGEPYTHSLANSFLWASFDTVDVTEYRWGKEVYRIHQQKSSSSVVSLIISQEQKMKIKLGQPDWCKKATKVVARSDGGLNIRPENSGACFYPMFCVEVYSPGRLDADMRPNGNNTVRVIMTLFIKGMPRRSMQKCWVKSVIRGFMSLT